MQYKYPCVRFKQTSSDKWLVQFAARATDINEWAGVPQKSRFEFGGETVGFQRQENMKRVNNLRDFYSNTDNIIQNPLLCSLRDAPLCSVTFEPFAHPSSSEGVEYGTLVVEIPDFSIFTMEDCLRHVRDALEQRVPELKDQNLDAAVEKMRRIAMDEGYVSDHDEQYLIDGIDSNDDETDGSGNGYDAAGVLFEESHLVDFWEVVAARHEVIKEVGVEEDRVEFLGFTKDVLVSYLRPIVLVDGQHRLRGAIVAAEERLKEEPIKQEAGDRIASGECAEEVQREILSRETRLLPISLLMSTSPEEQVFQFVVVNQKATPIGRALLGTIVSTTLAKGEMDKVADRLKSAGIEVEESQAVTYLARHPSSPFVDRVERGLSGAAGDGADMLKWNVLASLVSIFRHLKGGKLFGQRNDYADIWAAKYLASSPIVSDYDEKGYESAIK